MKCVFVWAGARVYWLWEKTNFEEFGSSNSIVGYWMDIFHINLFEICTTVCLKRPNKNKKGQGWPIKNKFLFADSSLYKLTM